MCIAIDWIGVTRCGSGNIGTMGRVEAVYAGTAMSLNLPLPQAFATLIVSNVWTDRYYGILTAALHDKIPKACYSCFDAHVTMVSNDFTFTSLYKSIEAEGASLLILY